MGTSLLVVVPSGGASLPGAATPKLIWSMSLAGSDTGIQLLIRLRSFLDGSI